KIGGGFATKRGELNLQKALLGAKNTASENNLRTILAQSTPFGLIPNLIKEVKEQLVLDERILRSKFEDEISSEKFKQLESQLESDTDWKKIDVKTRTALTSKISKLFESKGSKKERGLFNLTQIDSANLLNIIENDIPTSIANLKTETEIYREIHEKLEKVDAALVSAPKDDELGPLVSELSSLNEEKLVLLEEYLLDAIQQVMHKKDFIQHVSVDKETFNITLYRKNKDPFPMDLLSKGEKQMLATAVLWALAKTSGKPLPFMIDTPLARLDLEHRDNLVEKFYPFASHQVLIFSTNSEIEGPEYVKLLPHITRSYAMTYQPEKGKTEVTEGYFWNKKGEKIASV